MIVLSYSNSSNDLYLNIRSWLTSGANLSAFLFPYITNYDPADIDSCNVCCLKAPNHYTNKY